MKAFVTGGTGFVGRNLVQGIEVGFLDCRRCDLFVIRQVDEALQAPASPSASEALARADGGRFGLPGYVHALQACYDTLGAP